MSDPQFDDHLRNTLSGHQTPLDTEALWDRLSPLLTEDKKRRRGFLWWWVGGAALVLALGIWRGGDYARGRGGEGATMRLYDYATVRPADDTDSPLETGGVTGGEGERVRGREGEIPRGGSRQSLHVAGIVGKIETRKFLLTREVGILPIPSANILAKPGRKKTAFVLRPEAGMGLVFKTLQSHPGDSSDYRQARLDTEETLEYVSGSLLAGVEHSSGFNALAGLGYTRINERFYTSGSRVEYDSIPDGIVEIYIDSNGDSIITRGNVPVTRYIAYRKRTYNQYTLIDVPVLLGYQWRQDRWSLGVEGGVYVNMALQSKGDILAEDGAIISLGTTENVMRPRVGLSYFGSLRLGYVINDKTQISLAPTLRVFSGSFTEKEYRLSQKYTLAGLNIGLSRRF